MENQVIHLLSILKGRSLDSAAWSGTVVVNSASSLGEADSAAQSKIHDNSNFSHEFLRS